MPSTLSLSIMRQKNLIFNLKSKYHNVKWTTEFLHIFAHWYTAFRMECQDALTGGGVLSISFTPRYILFILKTSQAFIVMRHSKPSSHLSICTSSLYSTGRRLRKFSTNIVTTSSWDWKKRMPLKCLPRTSNWARSRPNWCSTFTISTKMANSASGNLNSSTQISENCKFNGPPRYTRNWGTTKMFVNTKPVTFSFLCQIGSNKSNEGHSSHWI